MKVKSSCHIICPPEFFNIYFKNSWFIKKKQRKLMFNGGFLSDKDTAKLYVQIF